MCQQILLVPIRTELYQDQRAWSTAKLFLISRIAAAATELEAISAVKEKLLGPSERNMNVPDSDRELVSRERWQAVVCRDRQIEDEIKEIRRSWSSNQIDQDLWEYKWEKLLRDLRGALFKGVEFELFLAEPAPGTTESDRWSEILDL
jgi:hypothetical protein